MSEKEPAAAEGGWEKERDLSQKLAKHIKAVLASHEAAVSSAEKTDFNLYTVPKLVETIKEVEMDNIRRRERKEEEIDVAGVSGFRALVEAGILEKDYDTTRVVSEKKETIHHTGHLAEIKKLAQREWDQQHPKE